MENQSHCFNPYVHLDIYETKTQVSESSVLDRVLVTDIRATVLQDFYDTNSSSLHCEGELLCICEGGAKE